MNQVRFSLKNKYAMIKEMNLILDALPAVTVPPLSLKLGRSFLSFAASNW